MARTEPFDAAHPYRAVRSLFDINIFKNEWVCDLEILLTF